MGIYDFFCADRNHYSKMRIVIALALVAFAAATEEESNDWNEVFWNGVRPDLGCKAPPMFESSVVQILPKRHAEAYAKMSYDERGQRIRMDDTAKVGRRKYFYSVIYLPKQGAEYIINRKTKKCIKRKIARKFWPIAVPANATRYGTYFIGASNKAGAGVQVATYGGKMKCKSRYFITTTVNSCIPVSAGGYSRRMGFSHMSFFNVKIVNRFPASTFTPPSGCKTREDEFEDIDDENF